MFRKFFQNSKKIPKNFKKFQIFFFKSFENVLKKFKKTPRNPKKIQNFSYFQKCHLPSSKKCLRVQEMQHMPPTKLPKMPACARNATHATYQVAKNACVCKKCNTLIVKMYLYTLSTLYTYKLHFRMYEILCTLCTFRKFLKIQTNPKK